MEVCCANPHFKIGASCQALQQHHEGSPYEAIFQSHMIALWEEQTKI